jgi:glycosyltransferase involved in cell wall biosynthesis
MHFIGGAERLMTELALGLADEETTVDVVTGVCHDVWRSQLSQKAGFISVKELGQRASGNLLYWLNINGFAKALATLISPETEVLITSNFPSSLVAHSFTERHKALVVHYLHDPIALQDKEGIEVHPLRLRIFYRFMGALYRGKDAKAIREGDMIIAGSQLSRKENAKIYNVNESDITVVYPGVNVAKLTPPSDVPQLVNEYVEKKVPILFVPKGAQFWRRQEVCLQALSRLQNYSFIAVFTGGADYEVSSLIKRARFLGISDKVLWFRELSPDEVNAMYSRSTIVVSIAKRQGFGLIPLEALILGCPSIISYSSGVAEVLRDEIDTIKVHDDNPEELAKAIKLLLLDDNMRSKIVSNGQRRVVEGFTSVRFANDIKEKLQVLADNPKHRQQN